jgi:hypothetical protein
MPLRDEQVRVNQNGFDFGGNPVRNTSGIQINNTVSAAGLYFGQVAVLDTGEIVIRHPQSGQIIDLTQGGAAVIQEGAGVQLIFESTSPGVTLQGSPIGQEWLIQHNQNLRPSVFLLLDSPLGEEIAFTTVYFPTADPLNQVLVQFPVGQPFPPGAKVLMNFIQDPSATTSSLIDQAPVPPVGTFPDGHPWIRTPDGTMFTWNETKDVWVASQPQYKEFIGDHPTFGTAFLNRNGVYSNQSPLRFNRPHVLEGIELEAEVGVAWDAVVYKNGVSAATLSSGGNANAARYDLNIDFDVNDYLSIQADPTGTVSYPIARAVIRERVEP